MIGRVGFIELLILLVILAVIAGIVLAVILLVRHFGGTRKRLENIERKLDEITEKEE